MYLGRKNENHFENFFEKHMEWKVNKLAFKKEDDEIEAEKRALEIGDEEEDDGGGGNVEEVKDYEEIFLMQFPYLSVHYRNNKRKIDRFGKIPGWSIMAGGWVFPTCCSMLIN
jgi:hypothetical protein